MAIFSIVPEKQILSEIDRIVMKGPEAGPNDVGKLIRWLEHPNPDVRKAVAEAADDEFLAADYGLTAAVMRHVQTDASPEVREACIGHLGFACVNHQNRTDFEAEDERRPPDYDQDCPPQYRELRELLAKIGQNDKEPESLRRAAIQELGHLGEDPAARNPVEAFLHHSMPGLRAAATTAAGLWPRACGMESQLLALLDDPDEEVQREALMTCGALRIPSTVDRLRPLLTSPNPSLGGAALIGFASCGPVEEATAILDELSESVKEDDPLYDDVQEARFQLTCRWPGDDEEPAEDALGDAEAEPGEDEGDEEIDRDVQALLDHEGRDKLTKKEAEDLAFVAGHFQEFLRHEVGMPLEALDKGDVEEYLLEHFPKKVTVPLDETSRAPADIARFLRYLGACGLLRNAGMLADHALRLRARFEEAMKDPSKWGMAKTLLMAAHATGVDIRDRKQLDAFMAGYNARLLGREHPLSQQAAARPKHAEPPALPKEDAPRPLATTSPKVGRNAPCPCGSGKKFKKCCGK